MELKKSNWLWGAVLFVAGLFMLINPVGSAKLVVMLLGAASIGYSGYNIFFILKNFEDEKYRKMMIIRNCVGIVFGTLAVLFALPFAKAAMKVGFTIFAIFLILNAAFGFYTLFFVAKDKIADKKRYIFENLALLIAAVLIFLFTPENVAKVLIRIFGVVALVAGIVFLAIEIITFVKNKKNTVNVSEEDVTVTDDPETSEEE